MTVSRPPELRVGDEVRVDGAVHTITAVSGEGVQLADVTGVRVTWARADLFTAAGFCVVTRVPASLPPQGLLDGVSAEVADQARWWEHHIVEVIAGVPPQAGRGATPKPEYDPHTCSLRQRELAKVAELETIGHKTPLSTLQRLRVTYEKHGIWGLVDRRTTRRRGIKTDERVLEAIRQAVAEETNRSTGTVGRARPRVPDTGCRGFWTRIRPWWFISWGSWLVRRGVSVLDLVFRMIILRLACFLSPSPCVGRRLEW